MERTFLEATSVKSNETSEQSIQIKPRGNFWDATESSEKNASGSLLKDATHAGDGKNAVTQKQSTTTEPPFPGDRYATDDTYLHSKCPDNIRQRMAKLSEYKDVVLETIPILQWSKHATEQEYKRLRRYNGAHGWGVISYEDLKDALSYLNTSANTYMFDDWEKRPSKTSVCIRCAVVGNGGILNDSRKGEEIDKHDYVFRVNGAIIKGFEKDVGTRTSFYTFSTNTMKNSLRAYSRVGYTGLPQSEETRYVFLPDHDRDYYLVKAAIMKRPIEKGSDKSKIPPTFFGENVGPEKFKMYHPDFIRYIRNRLLQANILKSAHRNIYRPSTGATMLIAAIHSCDEVSAYGFITNDYAKYSDHYFDQHYHKLTFYANHDMRLEMRLWKKLHDYGIIKLYTREKSENKNRR
ncbi:alpha-N-acetylgalactosaminide alpha-2,6-sialyltransferase 2 isoform X2 [Heptranchias perlo]|uniref:alpha-N-acetylgalactosaminide alpha-2,6-sialyltransferase 2 isoform X2 n=1 Tax=Heptranchias perlo TaxID=212740 RepID=UPI0035599427